MKRAREGELGAGEGSCRVSELVLVKLRTILLEKGHQTNDTDGETHSGDRRCSVLLNVLPGFLVSM